MDEYQKQHDDFLKAAKAGSDKLKALATEKLAPYVSKAHRNFGELLDDEDAKIKLDTSKFIYRLIGMDIDRSQNQTEVVVRISSEHAEKIRNAKKLTKSSCR